MYALGRHHREVTVSAMGRFGHVCQCVRTSLAASCAPHPHPHGILIPVLPAGRPRFFGAVSTVSSGPFLLHAIALVCIVSSMTFSAQNV